MSIKATKLINGIDQLLINPSLLNNLGRIGVLTNQATIASTFESTLSIILRIVKQTNSTVTCLFGPQHGYFQTEQDNMKETPDLLITIEGESKPLQVFSLYGGDSENPRREPSDEQLTNIDTLIVDLIDVGCRIYTYMLTLALCLRAAKRNNKRVIVLDRPNPLGLCYKQDNQWFNIEGNLLENEKFTSFVGWYPIPMRHGLTLGELGKYFIEKDNLQGLDYRVITVQGLYRNIPIVTIANELSNYFGLPSPNMPSWLSALFFPSFVALETCNISEGRGTTLPFQLIGSPFLNADKCIQFLNEQKEKLKNSLDGLRFTRHDFRPTFNKHAGNICHGIFVHFNCDPNAIDLKPNVFTLGILFLYFCCKNHANQFKWNEPGYEYNYKDNPMLLVLGSEKWFNFFQKVQMNALKLEEQNEQLMNDIDEIQELYELIQWSYNSAIQFAEQSIFAHLYN
eukprot:TRINITY_DN44_c3_g1_i1.p1 TRINITY_DN44_c3_g1~~TRINITY_DN44_c3_g1_i1.p1  ORF type:complete len:469 (-),score=178.99 TRINITY_DN44_c3_g1_i1:5-1366(-)